MQQSSKEEKQSFKYTEYWSIHARTDDTGQIWVKVASSLVYIALQTDRRKYTWNKGPCTHKTMKQLYVGFYHDRILGKYTTSFTFLKEEFVLHRRTRMRAGQYQGRICICKATISYLLQARPKCSKKYSANTQGNRSMQVAKSI